MSSPSSLGYLPLCFWSTDTLQTDDISQLHHRTNSPKSQNKRGLQPIWVVFYFLLKTAGGDGGCHCACYGDRKRKVTEMTRRHCIYKKNPSCSIKNSVTECAQVINRLKRKAEKRRRMRLASGMQPVRPASLRLYSKPKLLFRGQWLNCPKHLQSPRQQRRL